jgi:hypothetical protein
VYIYLSHLQMPSRAVHQLFTVQYSNLTNYNYCLPKSSTRTWPVRIYPSLATYSLMVVPNVTSRREIPDIRNDRMINLLRVRCRKVSYLVSTRAQEVPEKSDLLPCSFLHPHALLPLGQFTSCKDCYISYHNATQYLQRSAVRLLKLYRDRGS